MGLLYASMSTIPRTDGERGDVAAAMAGREPALSNIAIPLPSVNSSVRVFSHTLVDSVAGAPAIAPTQSSGESFGGEDYAGSQCQITTDIAGVLVTDLSRYSTEGPSPTCTSSYPSLDAKFALIHPRTPLAASPSLSIGRCSARNCLILRERSVHRAVSSRASGHSSHDSKSSRVSRFRASPRSLRPACELLR